MSNQNDTQQGTVESVSYKTAFATLKSIAEQMRSQSEPDIDALVPMVDKAVSAYGVCKERIATVKAMLEQRFGNEGEASA